MRRRDDPALTGHHASQRCHSSRCRAFCHTLMLNPLVPSALRTHAVAQPIRLSLGSIASLSAPEPPTSLKGVPRSDYVSGTGGGLKAKDPNHFQHLFALSRGEAWRATADEDRGCHKRQREQPDCRASHGSTPEG